jgi:hypothetical protein
VLSVSAYDRRGIETFSRFLRSVLAARPTLLLLQQRRDLKYLLRAMAEDLDDAGHSEPAIGQPAEPDSAAAFREKLRRELHRLRGQEERTGKRWVGASSTPRRLAERLLRQIASETSSSAKQSRAQAGRRVALALARRANAEAMALTRDASNTVIKLGVPLRQKANENAAAELDLKEAYLGPGRREKLTRIEAYRAEKGFLRGLVAYLRNDSYRDIEGPFKQVNFEADLHASLKQIEEPVIDALKWLEQNAMAPLEHRLDQEVHAQAEAQTVRQHIEPEVREAAAHKLRALAGLITDLPVPSTPTIGPLVRSLADPAAAGPLPREPHAALFGLLETFAETAIQEELLALLRRLTGKSNEPLRVLLLGHDRRPLLHLCALLCHDVIKAERFPDAQPDKWLRLGRPIELPGVAWADEHGFDSSTVPLFKQVSLVLGPADEQLATPLVPSFLRFFDAVGIHVDAARLGHARANLRRARPLYMQALSESRLPMFFVNGMGRDFSLHLSQLLTEVLDSIAADHAGGQDWFVFDDYDIRYTRYMQLGRQVLAGRKSILALWREAGLLFSEPFTEEALEKSIHAAQQKRRTTSGTQERVR